MKPGEANRYEECGDEVWALLKSQNAGDEANVNKEAAQGVEELVLASLSDEDGVEDGTHKATEDEAHGQVTSLALMNEKGSTVVKPYASVKKETEAPKTV